MMANPALYIGQKFYTLAELEKALHDYEEKEKNVFVKKNSKTAESCKVKCKEGLLIYEAYYRCKCAGEPKSGGNKTISCKTDCQAAFTVRAQGNKNEAKQYLQILSFNKNHNHDPLKKNHSSIVTHDNHRRQVNPTGSGCENDEHLNSIIHDLTILKFDESFRYLLDGIRELISSWKQSKAEHDDETMNKNSQSRIEIELVNLSENHELDIQNMNIEIVNEPITAQVVPVDLEMEDANDLDLLAIEDASQLNFEIDVEDTPASNLDFKNQSPNVDVLPTPCSILDPQTRPSVKSTNINETHTSRVHANKAIDQVKFIEKNDVSNPKKLVATSCRVGVDCETENRSPLPPDSRKDESAGSKPPSTPSSVSPRSVELKHFAKECVALASGVTNLRYRSNRNIIDSVKSQPQPLPFKEKKYDHKVFNMLNWLNLPKNIIDAAVIGKYKIKKVDIDMNPQQIGDSFVDKKVNLKILEKYFDADCFKCFESAVAERKIMEIWKCGICDTDEEGNCVYCDSCLTWYHFTCAGVSRKPRNQFWFCAKCTTRAT